MSDLDDRLVVTTNVSRDVLQTAALFKSDRTVVWEYVSNGLQYVDPGTDACIRVRLDNKRKRISIEDNGRGMDWAGLINFFRMHGENLDRLAGRPGRGRFGTGKAAAFGIASLLRVTSVRNRRRSCVELERSEIERATTGEPIPVRIIEKDADCDKPSGTLIEIDRVHLRTLDQRGIIHYIERHLAKWPRNSTVLVNSHECEYAEPPVAFERRITPGLDLVTALGEVELVLKASKVPLEDDFRGVDICSNGVWHEITLAGSEGRDMSQYIFGEVDVPRLDTDSSPISPFDMSRSGSLNANNDVVQAIYCFLGQEIEKLRKELVQGERRRRADEEAQRLEAQAEEIAKVINEDFVAFKSRVSKARAKARGGADLLGADGSMPGEGEGLLEGDEIPAAIVAEEGGLGSHDGSRSEGGEPRTLNPVLEADSASIEPNATPAVSTARGTGTRGGFGVDFGNMGQQSNRAVYQRDNRIILINLDHPQISAAKGSGPVENLVFKRLAYEVAFTEYAIALASELDSRGEYIEPSDPILDIQETVNRLAVRAASLYREG